jgi:hypothetical protein
MTVSEHFIAADAVLSPKTAASLSNLMKRLMQRVKLWVNAYADYAAAAAMYEHLSGLSNAELQKTGALSRHACLACLPILRQDSWPLSCGDNLCHA